MRYRAFISYSHSDAATASWLHRKLEGWRVPKRMRESDPSLPQRLAPIFRDREELASAGELGPQIQAALAESDALIVLCSPQAAHSRWVDAEVQAFRNSGRGDRVFALIVAGEPNSGDERECFPPALLESEPLAADLRPGKDGKELALLKLISGLLGVPLDTLRQREARRRHQRMLAVTALALVVTLVTSFLAVQAVIARQAAERRQKQAEALVGFMLGDLNDKLTEVSRLDILEGVHDHAMDYFKSLPDTDVTDQALEQRAQALVLIGNVRREQGHSPKALEAYDAASKITGRLAQQAPGNVPRQLAHAEVLTYIGLSHWFQGELDQAQTTFDAARELLLRAQAKAPRDTGVLYQLSTIDNNSGHVLEGRGRIAEASRHYRSMRVLTQQLVAIDPKNSDWQNQLGLAHNNLAKMSLLQGDLAGAVAGYRADAAIETAQARRDPRDNYQAERDAIARATLGRTLALTGALDEGATILQGALDDARRLLSIEPDSTYFQEDVALYSMQLARLRRLQGRLPEARALSAAALGALDGMLAKDPAQPGWLRERAEALLERAHQAGAPADARADLKAALAILEAQFTSQPDDRAVLLALAEARLHYSAFEPSDAAQARLRSTLAICARPASGADDPRLRALRVALLSRLGEAEQAHALAAELWTSGYRDAAFAGALRERGIDVPSTPADAPVAEISP